KTDLGSASNIQDYLLERPGFFFAAGSEDTSSTAFGANKPMRRSTFLAILASEGLTPTERVISLAVALVKRILPVRRGYTRSSLCAAVEVGLDMTLFYSSSRIR